MAVPSLSVVPLANEATQPAANARKKGFRWLEPMALALSVVCVCAVHGPLIGYKAIANVDEAYASALGERLLEGFKLYDGAVSQRGPLMYYTFEFIAWLHGWDNIVALRLWALGLCLLHLIGVWWIGRKLLSREATVVATLLTGYALAFGFPAYDGYALHGETLQLPALLGAVLLSANAVRRAPGSLFRLRWLVGAGLCFGIAASIKQSVLLHPIAVVVWLAVDWHRRKVAPRVLVTDLLILASATLFVPLIFIVHAAQQGTLSELVYYCFTYNRTVHMRPSMSQSYPWLAPLFYRLSDGTQFFVLLSFCIALYAPTLARRVRAARRERNLWALGRGFGVGQFLALNLLIAVLSTGTMYRFFPHYFLQAMPFLALVVGWAVAPLARTRRWGPSWRQAVFGFAGLLFGCAWLGTVFGEKVDGRVMHDRTVDDVAKLIKATTTPDDRIFVWGFSPWLYMYSHRRPAGRYVFETYVTGVVPWFWEKLSVERARIVPGSVEALLGDLDREKPAVVVDAGSIMLARPMRAYAPFAEWLHAHYCFDLRIGAFDLYRRKPDESPCAMPYYPRPFGAIDWSGHGLPLPVPALADEEMTKPLPHGNFFKPIWFKGEPTPIGLDAIRDKKRDKDEADATKEGFRIERTDFDWTADAVK